MSLSDSLEFNEGVEVFDSLFVLDDVSFYDSLVRNDLVFDCDSLPYGDWIGEDDYGVWTPIRSANGIDTGRPSCARQKRYSSSKNSLTALRLAIAWMCPLV